MEGRGDPVVGGVPQSLLSLRIRDPQPLPEDICAWCMLQWPQNYRLIAKKLSFSAVSGAFRLARLGTRARAGCDRGCFSIPLGFCIADSALRKVKIEFSCQVRSASCWGAIRHQKLKWRGRKVCLLTAICAFQVENECQVVFGMSCAWVVGLFQPFPAFFFITCHHRTQDALFFAFWHLKKSDNPIATSAAL